jgi:hypothetical protein
MLALHTLPDSAPLRGMRVLLIEDCGTIGIEGALQLTTFIRRVLGAATVELKASFTQAQKRLQASGLDLCLIDYDLGPGPTGVDLARWMAAQPTLASTYRVLWSATPMERLPAAELPTLFHLLLAKDSTPTELRQSFTNLLQPAITPLEEG